jgi:ribosomal protein L40E
MTRDNVLAIERAHRAALVAYVAEVRAATVCRRCAAQPIVWHHPDHGDGDRKDRVGNLVQACAPLKQIHEELARCVPLCRKCHYAEHANDPRPQFGRKVARHA